MTTDESPNKAAGLALSANQQALLISAFKNNEHEFKVCALIFVVVIHKSPS